MVQQEFLIACDADGNPLVGVGADGTELSKVERGRAHRFGITHLALMFTYKNSKNEIYIAQRAARREDLESQGIPTPFGNFWDASAAGHYRWSELIGNALVDKKARIVGELAEEFSVEVEPDKVTLVGNFRYSSPDPSYSGASMHVKESEVCYLAIIYDDREPKLNSEEVSRGQWIEAKTLREEAERFARRYAFDGGDGSLIVKKTPGNVRALTPWFLRAQQKFPDEIYEYRPSARL